MFLPKDIIDGFKKKYAPGTIITTDNALKRLYRECFKLDKFDKKLLTTKIPEIKEYITTCLKVSSGKSMVHRIIAIVGKENKSYAKFAKYMNKKHDEVTEYAKPSKELIARYETLSVIDATVNLYDMETQGDAVKKFVAALYKYLPALRGEDYFNTYIYEVPDNVKYSDYVNKVKRNILDIRKWILVIKYQKSKVGIRMLKFPSGLIKIAKEWIKISGRTNSDSLLINMRKKKFTQNAFTHLLWRIYGNNFSTQILRRIYISEMVRYLKTFDYDYCVKWRKRLSKMVGHTLQAQEFTYSTYNAIKDIPHSSKEHMEERFKYLQEAYISD